MAQDAGQPLEFSSELRGVLSEMVGSMDHSVAHHVMAAVTAERARRRTVQSLWLGLSPAIAVAIVIMIYVGGSIVPVARSTQTSRLAMNSSGAVAGFTDSAPKAMVSLPKSASPVVACQSQSLHIALHGDALLRQTLIIWLRSRHPDIALEMEQATSGKAIAFDLSADETVNFAALMVLHGFVGQSTQGLRVISGYSLASWTAALDASSLHICCIP